MRYKITVMKICAFLCNERVQSCVTGYTDKVMLVLQNINTVNIVPGSYKETYDDYDGHHDDYDDYDEKQQVVDMKLEEVTDVEEEEGPDQITFPALKAEHKVSCMFVCTLLCILHKCLSHPFLYIIHIKQLHSGEWIFKSPFHIVSRILLCCVMCGVLLPFCLKSILRHTKLNIEESDLRQSLFLYKQWI
jgi:hypothetical protein